MSMKHESTSNIYAAYETMSNTSPKQTLQPCVAPEAAASELFQNSLAIATNVQTTHDISSAGDETGCTDEQEEGTSVMNVCRY